MPSSKFTRQLSAGRARSHHGRKRVYAQQAAPRRKKFRRSRFGVPSIISFWADGTREGRVRANQHPRRVGQGHGGPRRRGFWGSIKSWWLRPGGRRVL